MPLRCRSRPLKEDGHTRKTEFTIRNVRNGRMRKIIVMGCKKREFETHDAEWRAALNQAIEYLKLIRVERSQTPSVPLHIIVAIGTHVRAFTHEMGATDAVPFHTHPNELLELAKDEKKVHEVLTEMNRITQ